MAGDRLLDRAREIADEVLFPAALGVDEAGEIPASHFALLADEGFYGLAAPAEHGGAGLEFPVATEILEVLAGGCLTTTFTWLQHHGVVLGLVATSRHDLRDKYLSELVRGRLRGGVAFAGAVANPPRLHATAVEGGYRLDGEAPFVSGWGIVDVLQVSARAGDTIVSGLVDAVAAQGMAVEPLRLMAAQGTSTVRLRFDGYRLPTEMVVAEVSHAEFLAGQALGSRINGCMPLGLVDRCARLIADTGNGEAAARLRARQRDVRARLDAGLADPDRLMEARAAAAELAFHAAGTLVAAAGSTAVLHSHHAQRLTREATFTLVAASRPQLRAHLVDRFSAGTPPRETAASTG